MEQVYTALTTMDLTPVLKKYGEFINFSAL